MTEPRASSRGYRATEVRALVENYPALLHERDTTARGLRALVAVADLKRIWPRLTPDEQEALLVMGMLGQSSREAALYYAKSHEWARKQYGISLENLTYLLNGGE